MIRRITLDNFMSHKHTVIELPDGLTVLVGPNNCGKSAVVAALQAVCGDTAGDFMVRHGERVCSVIVETDDAHEITWRRKGGAVSYVIDGREVSRIGRGNLPDDLHEHLKLAKVEPAQGGKSFDVHLGLQKSPIFLIDSESDAAAFFSTSSDAERLLQIQRLHKQKVVAARGEHRAISDEVRELDAQLVTLAPLGEISGQVENAEAEHARLTEGAERTGYLSLLVVRILESEQRRNRLQKRAEAMAELQALPVMVETVPLAEMIEAMEAATAEFERQEAVKRALVELQLPPVMADTLGTEQAIARTKRAAAVLAFWRERADATEDLSEPPRLEDEGALARMWREMRQLQRKVTQCVGRIECLKGLAEPPAPMETAGLSRLLDRLKRARIFAAAARLREATLADLREAPMYDDPTPLANLIDRHVAASKRATGLLGDIRTVKLELESVEQSIDAWLDANPNCPMCGASTQREHVLAGGHEHG